MTKKVSKPVVLKPKQRNDEVYKATRQEVEKKQERNGK